MNLNFKNKTALVCGSTQGIGKAIAAELASLGANIVLIARDEEKLKAVLSELCCATGQKHFYIKADFSNPSVVKAAVENFISLHSDIHILVNNTGGPTAGSVEKANIDDFQDAFRNHLICNHILMQSTLNGMKKLGYGRIINIISTSVKQPLKGLGVSNTIRAAVANWAKTLATELAPHGITVNNVLPGATNTKRLSDIMGNKSAKSGRSVQEIKEEMLAEIPALRFALPEEIACAVAFLASPAASYITGINLPVDGGRTSSL